jgi:uncharacterized protein YndB with AHSA1/START domain
MANKTTVAAPEGKQELFIIREFDAPRELVFKAFTDPEIVVQFLGPDKYTMTIEKWDMRSGGSYRYINTDEKGQSIGFHGSIHEVFYPERIIQTFEFEGMPERGHVSLDFMRLETLPEDRTRVVMHSILPSVADRDGMVMSGMETGLNEGFNRLDVFLLSNKIS